MPILQPRDREAVEKRFSTELKQNVSLKLYTQPPSPLFLPGRECPTCGPTQELLQELCDLSDKLTLEIVDYYKDAEAVSKAGIERIPAFVIGNGDGNARFYGIPSGYEFAALLDTIVAAGTKSSTLELETRRQLKRLTEDVHIQVFVTPTCGYCSTLAHTAHAMALESPHVHTDVVEVQEFPNLARKYSVKGVPRTIINDRVDFTGAVPESVLVQRILEAAGLEEESDEADQVLGETTPVS